MGWDSGFGVQGSGGSAVEGRIKRLTCLESPNLKEFYFDIIYMITRYCDIKPHFGV
jgi:hypothetical protein